MAKKKVVEEVEAVAGSSLEQAIAMVQEMCQSTSSLSLSKQMGLGYPTLGKLSKGKGERISNKAFETIKAFYDQWKSGEIQLAVGRVKAAGKGGEVPIPYSKMNIDKKALLKEKELLERKLAAINTLLMFY